MEKDILWNNSMLDCRWGWRLVREGTIRLDLNRKVVPTSERAANEYDEFPISHGPSFPPRSPIVPTYGPTARYLRQARLVWPNGEPQSSPSRRFRPLYQYSSCRATLSLNTIVVGAGIGGLAAAYTLAHAGYRITLLESTSALDEVGAGIQVSPLSWSPFRSSHK
jgi:hypothetical protein